MELSFRATDKVAFTVDEQLGAGGQQEDASRRENAGTLARTTDPSMSGEGMIDSTMAFFEANETLACRITADCNENATTESTSITACAGKMLIKFTSSKALKAKETFTRSTNLIVLEF